MTRKDYELVAGVIAGRVENAKESKHFGYSDRAIEGWIAVLSDLADMMAYELSLDNKAFDRELFLRNCGVMSE